MAESAIVARLQLDSKDYDKKLADAKKKTKDFSKGGIGSLGELTSKFGALAAAVGGCKAAMEVFNRVINSSQTYADTYGNIMGAIQGTIDNVVYSLANADFSSFERGLRKVAEASWAASAALDQLWNTKQSASYFTNKNRERLAEMLNIAKDESKTAAQRKAAQDAIDAILKDQQEVVNTTRQDVDAAIYALVNKASGGRLQSSDVDRSAIESALRIDVSVDRDKLKADLEEQYKIYQEESERIAAKYMQTSTMSTSIGAITTNLGVSEEGKSLLAELDAKYADIIVKHSVLEVMSDEQLSNLIAELNYAEQNEKILQKMVGQYVAINNQLNKPIQSGTTGEALTGAQYAQSFGEDYYHSLGIKGTALGRAADAARSGNVGIVEDVPIIDTTLEDENPLPALSTTAENMKVVETQAYSSTDALNALGGAMSSLSGVVGEGAAAWLEWGANLLSAISTARPQIAALTAAKSTEATANTASAASGAAASVASIPYVGPIMAVAAVASIVAALANLPKFATGGVVPGNMMSGDNVLIRANSGEVVLTRDQANNIGDRLRGGMNGHVEFRIKGDTLVGVLNNHNRIASRSYGV